MWSFRLLSFAFIDLLLLLLWLLLSDELCLLELFNAS